VSPSWIERVRWRFAAHVSAGLAIGRDYVGFAQLTALDGGWEVQASNDAMLDAALFSGEPSAQAAAALAKALKALTAGVARRYVPVHVSLPDAAVHWGIFELDQMPKTRAAQLDLVRLRFGRQGINGAQAYACQPLDRDGDKHLLLGMAVDESWRRLVGEALAQAGVVVWSTSANVCRQFNCFHDRFAQASGALVALAPDAWCVWLWDSQGRVRYARARWRAAADDHADIALEVERSILAYVHGDPRRTVARVYTVAGDETGALAGALDARLSEPCARLSAEDAGVRPSRRAALPALAAALER